MAIIIDEILAVATNNPESHVAVAALVRRLKACVAVHLRFLPVTAVIQSIDLFQMLITQPGAQREARRFARSEAGAPVDGVDKAERQISDPVKPPTR